MSHRTSPGPAPFRWARLALRGLVGAALLAGGAPARADTGSQQAEALFEQARARMATGDYTAACPKFEESYRLDPANGTLLGLAICHENEGKWATATAEFTALAAAAARDGRGDRAAIARKHIALLDPKVSKLAIELSADAKDIPALAFECDGMRMESAASGMEVPLDPGVHVLQVSAPGRAPWTTSVTVGVRSERIRVLVPALASIAPAVPPPVLRPGPEVAPRPPPSEAPPPPPRAPEPAVRAPEAPLRAPVAGAPALQVAALVVGAAGVVTTAVGAWEGFHAIDENNSAHARCPASPCASPSGVALSHSAVNDATVADVLLGVGAAAVLVGAYLAVRGFARPVAFNVGPRAVALRVEW